MCFACLKRVSQTRALVSLPHESAVCSGGGCSHDSGDSVPTDLKTLELPLLCSLRSLNWVLPFSFSFFFFKLKVKQVARTCLEILPLFASPKPNVTCGQCEHAFRGDINPHTGRWRVFTTVSLFSSSFLVKYVFFEGLDTWSYWCFRIISELFLLEDFFLGNSEASASLSKQWHIRLLKHLEGWWKHSRTSEENLRLTNSTPVALKSLWTFAFTVAIIQTILLKRHNTAKSK